MKPYMPHDKNYNYYTIYRFFCKKLTKGQSASQTEIQKIQELFKDLHIQELLEIYTLATQKIKYCDMRKWISLQLWRRQYEISIHSFKSIEIIKKINQEVTMGINNILNGL
jgi:nicotinic acid phosphoribosyltransferase